MLPFLTDAEIDEICAPLVMPTAQRRYLQRLGLLVASKPNGRALVARSEFERVLGAGRFASAQAQNSCTSQPDRAALLQVIKGAKRGAQAQGR